MEQSDHDYLIRECMKGAVDEFIYGSAFYEIKGDKVCHVPAREMIDPELLAPEVVEDA